MNPSYNYVEKEKVQKGKEHKEEEGEEEVKKLPQEN